MASKTAEGLRKIRNLVENMQPGEQKIADLARDTTDVHGSTPFTTDHGVKVSDTDNWLRFASENQTGPALLEDQIAREKVFAAFPLCHVSFRCFRATRAN